MNNFNLDLNNIQGELLSKYSRPIVHMRQQLNARRFGLILGSGVSKPYGFPNWKELISAIASDEKVSGAELINANKNKSPQASLTQMLFEHYKAKRLENFSGNEKSFELEQQIIIKEWREIVHSNLYKNDHSENKHAFIEEFLGIIKRSSMTINYNFDDTIERLLSERREGTERKFKGYEVVTDARSQFRLDLPVIYHPNGFLPKSLLEGPSENLIFSEDSFADQLLDSMAGHYSTLLHHLSKNTCLLMGLSLEDSTLKHLLRQNTKINPGNFHYYVAYTPDPKKLGEMERQAILSSNFETYNLITLFLSEYEIRALGQLIQMESKDFVHLADEQGQEITFVFYITGVPGSGKTTTVSYFRSLATYAEWPDQKPPLLGKAFTDLNDSERVFVDEWIAEQFAIKNLNLLDQKEGIHIVDRCPLDPVSFTPDSDWRKKAILLLDRFNRGKSHRPVKPGHLILLNGDEEIISFRLATRHKEGSPDYIKGMYQRLLKIYCGEACTELDTSSMSIPEMIKRIAHFVFLEIYHEVDLQQKLIDIRDGKLSL